MFRAGRVTRMQVRKVNGLPSPTRGKQTAARVDGADVWWGSLSRMCGLGIGRFGYRMCNEAGQQLQKFLSLNRMNLCGSISIVSVRRRTLCAMIFRVPLKQGPLAGRAIARRTIPDESPIIRVRAAEGRAADSARGRNKVGTG